MSEARGKLAQIAEKTLQIKRLKNEIRTLRREIEADTQVVSIKETPTSSFHKIKQQVRLSNQNYKASTQESNDLESFSQLRIRSLVYNIVLDAFRKKYCWRK